MIVFPTGFTYIERCKALGKVVMCSIPGAFYERPEALNGVGVRVSVRIGNLMVDNRVWNQPANSVIALVFIRNQERTRYFNRFADKFFDALPV